MAIGVMAMLNTACDKETELTPQNTGSVEKLSAQVLVTNYKLIENPAVSEADLSAEFLILNDGIAEEDLPTGINEQTGNLYCRKQFKDSLYFIFTKLELTKEQAIKVHYALNDFHKCKMHHYALLKKINHEIIEKANKERYIIMMKLKNNEITKEQAEKKLKELKLMIEDRFKNDPVRKKILENLYKCHLELLENLRLILTKDQWEKFLFYLKGSKV